MAKPYTIATPRYFVRSSSGTHCDIFNKRNNAIKACIALASEYTKTQFLVVKQVFNKETIVFQCKIDMDADFEDLSSVYEGMLEAYQGKSDKIKFWRKI